MTVGYVPHAFDLFNIEHLDLLDAARSRAERVVVAVLPDHEVLARYGRPPVVPLIERLEIVRHVRGVDDVVVHDADAVPADAQIMVAAADAGAWPGAEVLPETRTSGSVALRQALGLVSSAVA